MMTKVVDGIGTNGTEVGTSVPGIITGDGGKLVIDGIESV
jgi:hypothetical protein